jgi:hypothetical protein
MSSGDSEIEPTDRPHKLWDEHPRQWSFVGRGMLWFMGTLVCYVLSIGPVMGVWRHSGPHSVNSDTFIVRFYDPVFYLSETPLGGPLNWWIDLWVIKLYYGIVPVIRRD